MKTFSAVLVIIENKNNLPSCFVQLHEQTCNRGPVRSYSNTDPIRKKKHSCQFLNKLTYINIRIVI